ncbi:MAG: cytochrome c3 family protein [Geoalkalibacter sp.]
MDMRPMMKGSEILKAAAVQILALALCALSPLMAVSAASSISGESCVNCHQALVDKGRGQRYVHAPFLNNKCTVCHIEGVTVSSANETGITGTDADSEDEVVWLDLPFHRAQEHWIQLGEELSGSTLMIKAKGSGYRPAVEKISLPPLSSLPLLNNDLNPPRLSEIRVTDVRKAMTVSVTLAWNTDEFSDSEVRFGRDELNSSKKVSTLTRKHEVTLVGLDPGKIYQYQVVSRDVHGNTARSALLEFDTRRNLIDSGSGNAAPPSTTPTEPGWHLYRVGENSSYLLTYTAPLPVTLDIGARAASQPLPTAETAHASESTSGHPLLKTSSDTNISICRDCHQEIQEKYSHPINVLPPLGMEIPQEYELMPDGRLSCMSCHSAHGSAFRYRLVKSGKADLCRGCHRNY